jgi:hypothetical protein
LARSAHYTVRTAHHPDCMLVYQPVCNQTLFINVVKGSKRFKDKFLQSKSPK